METHLIHIGKDNTDELLVRYCQRWYLEYTSKMLGVFAFTDEMLQTYKSHYNVSQNRLSTVSMPSKSNDVI